MCMHVGVCVGGDGGGRSVTRICLEKKASGARVRKKDLKVH